MAMVDSEIAPPATAGASQGTASGAPGWAMAHWDVVVIGGGNAGVVAALAAHDLGARVLIVERAPRHMRGGNSRHTRNIRCVHEKDSFSSGAYHFDELWRDLCKVGEGPNNEELARFTVEDSATMLPWMYAHGARWQMPLSGTLHLDRTNRFFLGGGKALLNCYYNTIARRQGIEVVYDAKVEDLEITGDRCDSVIVSHGGARHRVSTQSVVCASGGFEASLDWLRQYWGDAVDGYIIRGTPYNDGHVLARLFAAGAARAGQERGFHAIAVDARSPRFDGGIATRQDAIPLGIVVNRDAVRFHDEGFDLWPSCYAHWGGHIARQPEQYAVALWDSKVNGLFLPPLYGAYSGGDIRALAAEVGLDPEALSATVSEFNASVVSDGPFNHSVLDKCHTHGLAIAKSHWAQRLDTPPYSAVKLRPGITFTYMGVQLQSDARVVMADGHPFGNIYAAGEIMSGNILSTGYMAGFGMTIGSVWGRQAGTEAAKNVR
jgi:tricarballylate dehydrogenase